MPEPVTPSANLGPIAVVAAVVVVAHALMLQAWQTTRLWAGPWAASGRSALAIELVPASDPVNGTAAATAPHVTWPQAAVPPATGAPGQDLRGDAVAPAGPTTRSGPMPMASTSTEPAAPTGPVQAAPPLQLHYAVRGQARGLTVSGEAVFTWKHDTTHYEASLDLRLRPMGSRRQESTGQLTSQGLTPMRFTEQARQEEATHFDRERGLVVFSTNQPPAALLPGAQDRLSVLMQLAALAGGQPARLERGALIEVPTASTRELDIWQLRVEDAEELPLPGGTLRTVRLVRQPRHVHDATLEIWLAPGLHYSPARLRLTYPGGDWIDQAWSRTDRP